MAVGVVFNRLHKSVKCAAAALIIDVVFNRKICDAKNFLTFFKRETVLVLVLVTVE